ncbi:Formamidopyrimidine-DNA glycosylase N-terminal domain-containing protein [Daldinia vernicosa]|uniref:Formamidopyrimidine-DNA glycosylase N-terminal domain-containing protein n=1 Tax=Daldinia vernicosa TaxID=114800 RepID=UPI0020081037|nr:Formamidopyrimidine-DNA glycosylase N-terminal domain-containing protein [Daldinia vernicosa]KAI0849840.1 Formamidopyrimidine-DNA glycosylase N-terminal domain-containing protein [Daldinia vernicosa]
MPEIAEVARVVHFLRLHLTGKTISKVIAPDDSNVFGKVGTSGPAFERALTGKKVVEVGSQGKYFWMVLSKPPHPVMHLGMSGWVQIKGIQTGYTRYIERTKNDKEQWPPKYWKFQLETDSNPKVEVAFTDFRRFGRIRLVHCPGDEIRKHSPLVENGPDPVLDKDVFTEDFLRQKMKRRHVPIKALLLDQATVSGIGNWVGDEIMYQAKLHPEQYCDDFDDADVSTLYKAIKYVCETAVEKLGDSDEFPEDWLFKHRWGKGKKDSATTLPNGDAITHITVGGRTTCVVPSVQKKRARATTTIYDVKEESVEVEVDDDGTESRFFKDKGKGKAKKQVKRGKLEVEIKEEDRPSKKVRTTKAKLVTRVKKEEKEEGDEEEKEDEEKPAPKASRKSSKHKREETKPVKSEPELGRRRSSRLSRVAA